MLFPHATRNYEAAPRIAPLRSAGRRTPSSVHIFVAVRDGSSASNSDHPFVDLHAAPLIAGVCIPELNSPLGYPITLILMFAIAIGQLLFFYKRGWFG